MIIFILLKIKKSYRLICQCRKRYTYIFFNSSSVEMLSLEIINIFLPIWSLVHYSTKIIFNPMFELFSTQISEQNKIEILDILQAEMHDII